ncbi:MAG TPA: hypothetical protein PK668_10210 [Myxococcota bacterium]|nr:hypothetical protein [Myxococcota bacterium]HRY93460.1 hypothetical protein [Myxococcota bacterium]HSA20307.1 hypothetical protein [Myxococcota bacterium]
MLRKLRSLPEPDMRREVLLERFDALEPEGVADFLAEVTAGAARRSVSHLVALEAASAAILASQAEARRYEHLAEVYRLAREAGQAAVLEVLVAARPLRGPIEATEAHGDPELTKLSLGERKYMARSHDRLRLERLLLDPEVSVIRNLLHNPSLVEADLVRLAARRPVRAEVLRVIYESPWGKRHRVRLALVHNPYTPTELALKLVGVLLARELRKVAADGNLHPLVRQAAARMQAER